MSKRVEIEWAKRTELPKLTSSDALCELDREYPHQVFQKMYVDTKMRSLFRTSQDDEFSLHTEMEWGRSDRVSILEAEGVYVSSSSYVAATAIALAQAQGRPPTTGL